MPRKYKKISECPERIRELIQEINSLPGNLYELKGKLDSLYKEFKDEGEVIYKHIETDDFYSKPVASEELAKLQSKYMQKLFVLLERKFVIYRIASFSFQNATFNINKIIGEKLTLLHIIESFKIWDIDSDRQKGFRPDFNLDKSLSAYSFNDDTTLRFTSFRVVEILTREKIPIERIRVCPVCNDIFWAKKLNSETCGKKECADSLGNKKRALKKQEEKTKKEKQQKIKRERRKEWLNQDFGK